MFRDLRHALRMLVKTKGWTAVLLISLALGIGINTTLFSALNGFLLRKLAVPEPDRLVRLRWVGENEMRSSSTDYGYTSDNAAGQSVRPIFSFAVYQELKTSNETLAGLLACAPASQVNVVVQKEAELASAILMSGNSFDVLGMPALAGRTITPQDDKPDATPSAMISYGYWQRRFGKNHAVVGSEVTVNTVPVTIVGVTPPDYAGIQRLGSSTQDILLPLSLDERISGRTRLKEPNNWWLQIVGRLKPGITAGQVKGNLEGTFRAAARAGWDSYVAGLPADQQARNQDRTAVPSLDVSSAARGIYDVRPRTVRSISMLGPVGVLVLLIVCANVANLLLSRAAARRKEIAVRLSLGAGRARLVRQLLTESVLLAAVGGVLAIVVAYWSRGLLPSGQAAAPLDWRVFSFAAGISVLTGLAFGIIPALRATRLDLAEPLKENSRSLSTSRTLLGKALLIVQVAISLVLLIGAGLFLRTVRNLRQAEVGFETGNLLLVSVNPKVNRYEKERSRQLLENLREAFQGVAGVRSVSLSQTAFLAGSTWTSSMYVQGQESGPERSAHMMVVSPEFFDTLGIPVLAGRGLTRRDVKGAPKVALINEAARREFFPEGSPLGKHFGFDSEKKGEYEVVGVVGDVKYSSLRDDPPPTVYQSYLQDDVGSMTFELRTGVDPEVVTPSVREAARRVDPNLPLTSITTQTEQVEGRLSEERVFARAYTLFAGLALLLASVGLFGLMSYSVSRRRNEMGIRLALGAQRTDVIRMVLRESMLLVAIGLAIGLAAAYAAGRLVGSMLYGLAPTDPSTQVLAVLVLLLVAGLAGFLPARRASHVDPIVALHCE